MTWETSRQTFWQALRATFWRGFFVIVPVVITVWVFTLLFSTVDGIISPLFDRLLSRHTQGLGFITMILLIMVLGVLSRNLIGAAIFKFFERVISSIPLARTIYGATRDLMNAFQPGQRGKSFREVVLVEYPRVGLSAIGFVTNQLTIHSGSAVSELISVYIPNPPNPTSGTMILLPRESMQVLDLSVEEGLKLVLSGGIVTRGPIHTK
ncbi:MAG TPA: DUF502 domain-containing protein [Bacteroidota bacterium]|jgi:uncharacterized membrane protein